MIKLSMYCFYPYLIIKALFNSLMLRLSQKSDSFDTFLNKLCSSKKCKESFWLHHLYFLFLEKCHKDVKGRRNQGTSGVPIHLFRDSSGDRVLWVIFQ